jgi:hypothetical protein
LAYIYNPDFRPVTVCLAEHTFNQILSELRKANVGTCTRTHRDGEKIALLWFIAVCKYHTRTNTHERKSERASESLYAAGALSQPITCAEHKSKGRLQVAKLLETGDSPAGGCWRWHFVILHGQQQPHARTWRWGMAALSWETRGPQCQNWDWNWLISIHQTNVLSNTSQPLFVYEYEAFYIFDCDNTDNMITAYSNWKCKKYWSRHTKDILFIHFHYKLCW